MRRETMAYIGLFFAQFTWSLGNIGMSRAIKGSSMPPLQFAFLRELYSAMIMAMIAVFKDGMLMPAVSDIPRLLVLGTCGTFLPHVLFLIGLLLTSPLVAAIYMPLIPVFGGLLAVITRTEVYNTKTLLCKWFFSIGAVSGGALIIIHASSATGVAHHTTHHASSHHASVTVSAGSDHSEDSKEDGDAAMSASFIIGNVCLLCNVLSFASFLFLQKSFLAKFPPMTLTTWGYSIGMIEMGMLALSSGQLTHLAVSTLSLELGCVLGFLVLVCTVVNYNLYTWANSILPSSTVSLFHGTNPVFTALLSHYILDTDVTAIHLVGGVMILSGLQLNMKIKEEGTPVVEPAIARTRNILKDF